MDPAEYVISASFFFTDAETSQTYTLSLHDALPILLAGIYNRGEVPFHEVYITPKILDGYGETMSKSKGNRSEEHTSELQSPCNLVCRLLLEKKNNVRAMNGHISSILASHGFGNSSA